MGLFELRETPASPTVPMGGSSPRTQRPNGRDSQVVRTIPNWLDPRPRRRLRGLPVAATAAATTPPEASRQQGENKERDYTSTYQVSPGRSIWLRPT